MARIAGINIPQNKLVHIGLTYIYGIGDKFSSQICSSLEIPRAKRINELTDDEILKIREYIDANFKVEGDLRRDYSLTIKRLIDIADYFLQHNLKIEHPQDDSLVKFSTKFQQEVLFRRSRGYAPNYLDIELNSNEKNSRVRRQAV